VTKDRVRNHQRANFGGTRSGGAGGHGAPDRPFRRKAPRDAGKLTPPAQSETEWIWGVHAGQAALRNPNRTILSVFATRNALQRIGIDPDSPPAGFRVSEAKEIDGVLPPGAVHQGLAVRVRPLEWPDLHSVIEAGDGPVAVLDGLTDPQNVGAVFRSAAAFGVRAVVLQTRNAPEISGVLAKAAAGALETVPEVRVVNISRTLDAMREAGWRVVGMAGDATQSLEQAFGGPEPLAIVLGAEGEGLRPGVAKSCSHLARIAMEPSMESLNVSAAAAVAFYEARRRSQLRAS